MQNATHETLPTANLCRTFLQKNVRAHDIACGVTEFLAPLHLYSNDAVDFCGTNHNILLMIRLLILAAFGIAIGMFISKLLSKKRDDDVIEGEVIDADERPNKPSLLPVLLLGAVIAGVVLFVLPRFGISVMGLLQKLLAFLPLIRGFLPF
ncbi:MAG: hypothetical protein ACPHX4_01580 [Candidatus Puniceispirillaceae bacterium]